jgi:hypothetical protein
MTKRLQGFQRDVAPAFSVYLREPLSPWLANNLAKTIDRNLEWTFVHYEIIDPSRLNGAGDAKSTVCTAS